MNSSPSVNPAGLPPALQQFLQIEQLIQSGQLATANQQVEGLLRSQPGLVPALLYKAEIELASGRNGAARQYIGKALAGHMDSPRTAIQLVRMLAVLSESTTILEIVGQLPPPMWDSAKSLTEIAQELSVQGAYVQARQFAEAAVQRDPDHPPSLYMLATIEVFYGNMARAAELCERVLRFVPGDPGTHWLLSRLRQPDPGPRIDRIRSLLSRTTDAETVSWLAYALHNELHDSKQHAEAWTALEQGCRAKRSLLDYTQSGADALFDGLCQWRAEELERGDGFSAGALRPIFVIGLHRSGTTLAERVLGGHSQVAAGGETYDIRAKLRRASGLHFPSEIDLRVVQHRDQLNYRAIGEGYLSGMAWRAQGKPIITDKLPSNYFNVGFIARALPEARFIHLNRDPIDVGLSSLRTLFSHACPYSYDQQEYVAHYRQYQRLMDHWRALLPERILDVRYDDLVNEPERTASEMARFVGLDFEPAMLDVGRKGEAVATASSVMMRDGIRRDRGKVWKAYESQLAPMIEALRAG
ncbi:tetratricopeptide repeat-containing sulfotransferase family protein [Pseudomarimonas salicorniae]|uniref:Sulfotransferase n=1 Tax=Pseudomarimonas salicorniae TaxID=2933270 RepID=A0ABT0GC68_9GAMM|nr:sulfotransferase [Lysobacter sp. CAU 1642]MCK7592131.1 sulfotransferase [Lysobacter sp. CAU 1642]